MVSSGYEFRLTLTAPLHPYEDAERVAEIKQHIDRLVSALPEGTKQDHGFFPVRAAKGTGKPRGRKPKVTPIAEAAE